MSNRNPPLDEATVARFERAHGITLPADYRAFLTTTGNGDDDVFPLGVMDDGFDFREWKENDGFVGTLAKPFPYTGSWNDLAGKPDEDDFESDADYERAYDAFEKRYFGPVDGAIPICHLGCALRVWLVVSGPHAGTVWEDLRADENGWEPLGLTFSEWCQRQA